MRFLSRPPVAGRVAAAARTWFAGAWGQTPKALFFLASLICALVAGMAVERHQVFPHALLVDADKTLRASVRSLLAREHDGLPGRLSIGSVDPDVVLRNDAGEINRVQFVAGHRLAEPVLFGGGYRQFADHCPAPASGCLAVEYTGQGEVAEAWPFYPDRVFGSWPARGNRSARDLEAMPIETPPGWTPSDNVYVVDVAKYDNGDLLAVIQWHDAFPYAGGLVRVDPDGSVKWRRWDYSHHSVTMVDSDRVWVAALRIQQHRSCEKAYMDVARLIDGSGVVVKEVPVTAGLIASPWGYLLRHGSHCDPTHLNHVAEIGSAVANHDELPGGAPQGETGAGADYRPGDLVVSLRNLSAFGIVDGATHRMKRVARGTFRMQHGVVHVRGPMFAMVDNVGAGMQISRLLTVDPVHGREQTIYPAYLHSQGNSFFLPPPPPDPRQPNNAVRGDQTNGPVATPIFTEFNGSLSLSPDGERAIVTYSEQGQAVELRLSDGQVLTLFDDLHDLPDGDDLRTVRARTHIVAYSREARPSDASSRK